MLALTRKKHERVVLTVNGIRIVVAVVQFNGDKVVLGFDAPPEVAIHREEVQQAIERGDPRKTK